VTVASGSADVGGWGRRRRCSGGIQLRNFTTTKNQLGNFTTNKINLETSVAYDSGK
jgi:hypothetical protein